MGLQYVLTRKGLMAGTSSTAHAITRTAPRLTRPDVMVRIYHISGKDRYSRTPGAGIDPFPGFSIGGFQLHPHSRGSIHSDRATTRARSPRSSRTTWPTTRDRRTGARAAAGSSAASPQQPAIARGDRARDSGPGPRSTTTPRCSTTARGSGQTAWHTVGTLPHGRARPPIPWSTRACACTASQKLRVADASVMPTIPSSNTNAPSIMIGEKAADLIRGAR